MSDVIQAQVQAAENMEKGTGALTANIVRLFFSAVIAGYLAKSIYEAEFFLRRTLGAWIVVHRQVPWIDYWTQAGEGRPYLNASWLFDIAVAGIEVWFGDLGLVFFKLVVYVLLVWAASLAIGCRAKSVLIGCLVAAVAACGLLVLSPFGPEVVGWLLFFCLLGLAYRIAEDDLTPGSQKIYLTGVALISLVYGNVHPSILLVALLCAATFLPETERPITKPKDGRRLFAALLLPLLISPYFGKQLAFGVLGASRRLSLEIELQINQPSVFQYQYVFMLLIVLALIVLWLAQPKALRRMELLSLCFLVIGSLANQTFVPYTIIYGAFLWGVLWGRGQAEGFGPLGDGISRFGGWFASWPVNGSLFFLLSVFIVECAYLKNIPVNDALLPYREVDYILEHQLPGPMMHDPQIGSYLVYRFAQLREGNARKAVGDSRTIEIFPAAGRLLMTLDKLRSGWEELFRIVNPRTVLCRNSEPFCKMMARDCRWKLVFSDGLPTEIAERQIAEQNQPPRRLDEFGWSVFSIDPMATPRQ